MGGGVSGMVHVQCCVGCCVCAADFGVARHLKRDAGASTFCGEYCVLGCVPGGRLCWAVSLEVGCVGLCPWR